MTIFVWDPASSGPSSGYEKGTAKHISTQGFKPTNHPLTVTTQGFILPVLVNIDIITGGEADIEFVQGGNVAIGEGTIFVDGMSPVIVEIGGVSEFEYDPTGTIDISGDAPWSIDADGNIIYDYTSFGSKALIGQADESRGYAYVSAGSLQLDGETVTNIEMNAIGAGELTLDGDANIRFTPADENRGGRGVIRTPAMRKAKILIPNYYIWYAPLLRRFALKLRGSAETEFKKADTFEFLRQLQTIDIKPEVAQPEFFRAINNYIKISPSTYEQPIDYSTKTFTGAAESRFESVNNLYADQNEFALLFLLDDHPPIAYLSNDKKASQIAEQNNKILDILDVL